MKVSREAFIRRWRRVWVSLCRDGQKVLRGDKHTVKTPDELEKLWRQYGEAEDDAEAYLGKIYDDLTEPEPTRNGPPTQPARAPSGPNPAAK